MALGYAMYEDYYDTEIIKWGSENLSNEAPFLLFRQRKTMNLWEIGRTKKVSAHYKGI